MYAAGARGGHADAEPARVFGVTAGGESGRLFVPDLDELDLLLMSSERFEDAVDAIAGKTEDRVNAPSHQPLDQFICYSLSHQLLPPCSYVRRPFALKPKRAPTDVVRPRKPSRSVAYARHEDTPTG